MITNCPGTSKEYDPLSLFKTILIPVDFTPEARRALILACELRRKYESNLHVFLLSDQGANDEFVAGLGASWSPGDVQASARNQLQAFNESICNGLPCLTNDTLVGEDVVKGIAKAARDIKATLVLLPAHDEKSVFRTRIEKITRELEVPVLVLKGTRGVAEPAEEKEAAERS